jgi:UDP-N-acetylglucosamine pyrophosphorylase
MNSFNTADDTARVIQKYQNHNLDIINCVQSRYPRISRDSLLPIPRFASEEKGGWYPPGHGDLYDAVMNSGLVDSLLAAGKEYLFVSNSDNLGATADLKILQHMIDSQSEFIMEVTDKTKADVKGGTLIDYGAFSGSGRSISPFRCRRQHSVARNRSSPFGPRRGLQVGPKVQVCGLTASLSRGLMNV